MTKFHVVAAVSQGLLCASWLTFTLARHTGTFENANLHNY